MTGKMLYHLVLWDFECTMRKPEEIRFWIENEIGDYDGKSSRAEEWCKNASVGDVYDDEMIHIEVEEG